MRPRKRREREKERLWDAETERKDYEIVFSNGLVGVDERD